VAAPAKFPRGFLYIIAVVTDTQHQFANLIRAETEFLGNAAETPAM